MSHDIWVGVVKGEHATPNEEMHAARISSIIVGVIAIVVGIAAKGQNVAHLVALAFAVAASSNLPAVLLTLYWKRCNTRGVVLGMSMGALSAIGLVLVSPNMTYPNGVRATNAPLIAAAQAKIDGLNASIATAADAETRLGLETALNAAVTLRAVSQTKIDQVKGQTRSLVGLEAPLIALKNPGILSIPIGFLCVVLGSLIGRREKRADELWEELYVRQNIGLHAEGASAH